MVLTHCELVWDRRFLPIIKYDNMPAGDEIGHHILCIILNVSLK